ncbi:MAG: heme exporter protein CcmD [Casimicrobiaceae bacterium]
MRPGNKPTTMETRVLTEFVAMGGYGFYVWGAYAVTAGVLAIEIVALRARRRRGLEAAAAGGLDGDADIDAEARAAMTEALR